MVALAVEGGHCGLVEAVDFFFLVERGVFLLCERRLNGKHAENLGAEVGILLGVLEVENYVLDGIIKHVDDIHAYALAKHGVAATLVDVGTLLVHHVVELEQALTDTEVVFLDALLGLLDSVGNHAVLYHLVFLEAEGVEHAHHFVGGEHTHQGVFKRHEEYRRTGIALTARTASELTVDAARLVALGAYDCEAASLAHLGGKLDVGTTAGHVGGDGYTAFATGKRHNLGLALVELGVEYLVGYFLYVEHAREQLGYFNRGRTHEHGASGFHKLLYLGDNGLVFFFLGAVHAVVHIHTRYGAVGGDSHDVELVDVPQFAGLCFGSTGHTG